MEEEKTATVVLPEEEEEEDDPTVKYCTLGSEECPVLPTDTEIYYQEIHRIRVIEGL